MEGGGGGGGRGGVSFFPLRGGGVFLLKKGFRGSDKGLMKTMRQVQDKDYMEQAFFIAVKTHLPFCHTFQPFPPFVDTLVFICCRL